LQVTVFLLLVKHKPLLKLYFIFILQIVIYNILDKVNIYIIEKVV